MQGPLVGSELRDVLEDKVPADEANQNVHLRVCTEAWIVQYVVRPGLISDVVAACRQWRAL